MKLVNSHLIPGGIVRIYDDTRLTTAKFEITLTKEGASETAVLEKMVADLVKISGSITDLIEKISAESTKRFLLEGLEHDRDKRRQAFLDSMKLNKSQVDNQSDEPVDYDD